MIRHATVHLPRPEGALDPAWIEDRLRAETGAIPLRWAVTALEGDRLRVEAALQS
ncbi:MAG TPA: hypothetical protein V6D00_11060 [Pantanalinema sp.]